MFFSELLCFLIPDSAEVSGTSYAFRDRQGIA